MRSTAFSLMYFFLLSPVFSQYKNELTAAAGNRSIVSRNGTINAIGPNWEINAPEFIRSRSINNDSVFRFQRKKDKLDSALAFVEYFDSLGNKLETGEFTTDNSQLWRITNYSYDNGLLFKKEQIAASLIKAKKANAAVRKSVSTYEYDSAGNNIKVILYDNVGDSSKKVSVTKWEMEYDSLGDILKVYETLPNQESYLKHKYSYLGGKLNEVATFDSLQNWIYSNIYTYNNEDHSQSIFLSNNSSGQRIQKQLFYDTANRLTKEDIYTNDFGYLDHVTETFGYNETGLVIWQSYQDVLDNTNYYEHHYTPAQSAQSPFPMDSVDYDKIYTKVEIQSAYPGGDQAWARFINQNLHYPDIAINAGIQGDVFVLFIVDKEGNVSNVRAVAGPQELREEAERVIKKSGKWTPAVQNGRQVKSYKNQPIKFRLESM